MAHDRAQPTRHLLRYRPAGVLITVVALAAGLAACTSGSDARGAAGDVAVAEPEVAVDQAWPLTGLPVDGGTADGLADRPAFAMKVSNSPEARPQTGLDHADVVYEEVTEGGVTRFLAVFHSDLPAVAGPIRSARPVDTQILAGLGMPGFAYSGAREEVRTLLAATPAASITEGAPGFFRDDGTYASHPFAPHDLFIRPADGLGAVTEKGALPLTDLGWRFDEEPPAGADPDADGSSVEIALSSASRTGWTYDTEAGVYRRDQNGTATVVTGPGRIGAANVVVLEVRHHLGDSGYPETDVVGQGPALVLRDGRRYPARWSKPDATSPLRLTAREGTEPFPFKPGPTWIHLPEQLPGV